MHIGENNKRLKKILNR